MQTLTLAMDMRRDLLADAIEGGIGSMSNAPEAHATIIERNDAPVRKAEGLELRTNVLRGDAPARIERLTSRSMSKINAARRSNPGRDRGVASLRL